MNPKRVITAVLLLFVVVSLAWLGAKEVARSKALKAIQGRPVSAAQAAPAEVPPPASVTPAQQAPKPAEEVAAKVPTPMTEEAPVPAPKKPPQKPDGKPKAADASSETMRSKVVVYYLHTTARCPSCLKIEAFTAAEVTGPLSGPLAEGRLEWKVLNVDEPKNEHFVDDYKLFTKSVVVSEVVNGKEVRWKRLDKVWDYLGDQQAFMKYVDDEIRAYLKDVS